MHRLKILAISIIALALVALPTITSSHNQRNPNASKGKLRKAPKPIANRYIVILNDDVVTDESPREVRFERVNAIANDHAQAHAGRVDQVYELR
jgi:hypothetical protein